MATITQAQADAVQTLVDDYSMQVTQGQNSTDDQQNTINTLAARRDALVAMLADATIDG